MLFLQLGHFGLEAEAIIAIPTNPRISAARPAQKSSSSPK
jgi:hypothetical protein